MFGRRGIFGKKPPATESVDSNVSRVVSQFLEERKAPLIVRHKGLTDARLAAMERSMAIMGDQIRRWPRPFKEMDYHFQEVVLSLFKHKSKNMKCYPNIPTNFIERMFDGLRHATEKENGPLDQNVANAFGCGGDGFVYAYLIITPLFSALEAAERSGVENRPVLDAVAKFFMDLDFGLVAEHVGSLVEAISTTLPVELSRNS